jgi:hypothetical protein
MSSANGAEGGHRAQVGITCQKPQAVADLPQEPLARRPSRSTWFAVAHAEQTDGGDQAGDRVGEHPEDGAEELSDEAARSGAGDLGGRLAAVRLGVAFRQLIGVEQGRQVDLVGGLEQHRRAPRRRDRRRGHGLPGTPWANTNTGRRPAACAHRSWRYRRS